MIYKLKKILVRYLDLRPGEYRLVFSLQMIIFLIIFTLLLLKPAVTSIFLTVYGIKSLPFAFIIIAFTAVGAHYFIDYIRKKSSLHKLIKITCLFHTALLVLFASAFYFNIAVSVFAYVGYIYVSIFALVLATQFWQLCNEAFNLRQAKRVFGPIGSGAIAGGIVGGYTASIIVPFIGNSGLFLVAAISLLLCFHLYRKVINSIKSPVQESFESEVPSVENTWHIFNYRHVVNLSIVLGVGVLLSKLIDYEFNTIAINSFDSETQLTAFLGICLSSFNVLSLLIQLFLSSIIIKRFGVVQSMSFFPFFLLIFSVLFLISPLLIFAILLKGSDGALKQSIYKSSTELSMMQLPKEIKNEAKNFIDLVIDSLATGCAGVLLLSLNTFFTLPLYILTTCIIVISLLWLWQLAKLKRSYTASFKHRISGGRIRSRVKVQHDIEGKELLVRLNDLSLKFSISELQNHLSNPLASIRVASIKRLDYYDFSDIQSTLESHLNDPDDVVLDELYTTFLKYLEAEQMMVSVIPSRTLRSQAIFYRTLAHEISHNYSYRGTINLPVRVKSFWDYVFQQKLDNKAALKLYLMEAIVVCRMLPLYPLVLQYLETPIAPEFTKSAIKAAQHGTFKTFGLLLFKLSQQIQYQKLCYESLSKYGVKTVRHIESGLLGNYKTYMIGWPHILSKIPLQKSLNTLFKLLRHNRWKLRNEALQAIHEMNKEFPFLDYQKVVVKRGVLNEIKALRTHIASMYWLHSRLGEADELSIMKLIKAQEHLIQRAVVQCFTYLGISHNLEDMDIVYRNLSSVDIQKKSIALDFLDDILDYNLKKQFLPLLELIINKNYAQAKNLSKIVGLKGFNDAIAHMLYQKHQLVRERVKSFVIESKDDSLLKLIEEKRFKRFEVKFGASLRKVS